MLKEPAKPSAKKMWAALKIGFSSKGVWLSLLFTPIPTMTFVIYFQWGGLFVQETAGLLLLETGLVLALMNTGAAITGFLGVHWLTRLVSVAQSLASCWFKPWAWRRCSSLSRAIFR